MGPCSIKAAFLMGLVAIFAQMLAWHLRGICTSRERMCFDVMQHAVSMSILFEKRCQDNVSGMVVCDQMEQAGLMLFYGPGIDTWVANGWYKNSPAPFNELLHTKGLRMSGYSKYEDFRVFDGVPMHSHSQEQCPERRLAAPSYYLWAIDMTNCTANNCLSAFRSKSFHQCNQTPTPSQDMLDMEALGGTRPEEFYYAPVGTLLAAGVSFAFVLFDVHCGQLTAYGPSVARWVSHVYSHEAYEWSLASGRLQDLMRWAARSKKKEAWRRDALASGATTPSLIKIVQGRDPCSADGTFNLRTEAPIRRSSLSRLKPQSYYIRGIQATDLMNTSVLIALDIPILRNDRSKGEWHLHHVAAMRSDNETREIISYTVYWASDASKAIYHLAVCGQTYANYNHDDLHWPFNDIRGDQLQGAHFEVTTNNAFDGIGISHKEPIVKHSAHFEHHDIMHITSQIECACDAILLEELQRSNADP